MLNLLAPFLLALRNRLLPGGRPGWRGVGMALFSLALALALYLVAVRVVGHFQGQSELGIILSLKIFEMAWILLFAMVVFSCMVAAVSTLFLSQDNEILFAAPLTPARLFALRYLTTSLYAGWMLFIFMLPILLAYGQVFQAGPLYWPLLPVSLLGVILAATGLGLLATIVLVNLFPARRTKDIVLYLSVCFGILIYLMFRLLRPEELVNPDNYGHFVEYLAAISTPAASYLPPSWAASLLSLQLLEREMDWLLLGLLLLTPVALFILGEAAMNRWFFRGYSKSWESFGGGRKMGSRRMGIMAKEGKTMLRDSTEWAQLFMVGALIIVYLYNFKILPLDRAFIREEYLANLLAFLNIGLSGFVCASLAARFVYPAISAEGGAMALLQSSPLSMKSYLWRKYFFYWPPFTILALLLISLSNHLLGVAGPIWWLSVGVILPLTWAVLAMALGLGAVYADFKAENRAATLGGWGAMVFLFSALSFEIVLIFGAAWPAWRVVRGWLQHGGLAAGESWLLAASLGFAGLFSLLVGSFFFKRGVKALEAGTTR